ncbi:MAG TPA: EFR1 family ferrodoxin [candidate division Zixibacteria bacterium]|nr:EFR1 family ferrodoxin [candidate division Zixibacteria bacterium]
MKIGLVYFSATGNTRKYANVIKDEIEKENSSIELIDITSLSDRQKEISFQNYNSLIFGFPVYGARVPSVVRNWFEKIKGSNHSSAMFFCYGGPILRKVHNETKELLEQRGFKIIASAEFLGKHSFNVAKGFSILEDRPNDEDFKIAREYAIKLLQKFKLEDFPLIDFPDEPPREIPPSIKNKPRIRLITHHPTRFDKECSMCRDCETNCSTGAFDADKGIADKEKCILCMRCIANCPDQVIQINDLTEGFISFMERLGLTKEDLTKKKSRFFI